MSGSNTLLLIICLVGLTIANETFSYFQSNIPKTIKTFIQLIGPLDGMGVRTSIRMLLTQDDRKISRSCLSVSETPMTTSSLTPTAPSPESARSISEINEHEWYTLQRKDRLLGWTNVYWGFKTQTEISPLSPGDVYQFRVRLSSEKWSSDWSEILTAATKDDAVSAASLHRALDQGHMTSARKVLALRIQALEIPSKLGRTPVAAASSLGDTAVVSMLLTCGADVNAPEAGSNRTPLMTAAFRGDMDLLHVLKERDAVWSAIDRFGQTALHYAAMNSQISSIDLAINEVTDVNIRDTSGWSPLMLAVTMGTGIDVLRTMLKNGSDANIPDKRGQTPLMQAILIPRVDIVKLLLEVGANIEAENIHGHTAYDMAKNSLNQDILKILPILQVATSENG